jgi:hypothetical protein
VLKWNGFEDINEVKKNASSTLNTIPKDFQNTRMFPAVAGPLEEVDEPQHPDPPGTPPKNPHFL